MGEEELNYGLSWDEVCCGGLQVFLITFMLTASSGIPLKPGWLEHTHAYVRLRDVLELNARQRLDESLNDSIKTRAISFKANSLLTY